MLSYENTIMLGEERVLVIPELVDGRCWCLTAIVPFLTPPSHVRLSHYLWNFQAFELRLRVRDD